MILVPLIVLPCAIVGTALVVGLDRAGALPRFDGGGGNSSRSPIAERVPKAAQTAALVLMGLWVVAWIVVLVVGLGVLSA